jgi:antitoxin PrlF
MKTTATLTSKGQITIPKVVRHLLGLHAGDALEFDVQQGRVEVRPSKPKRTSSGVLKAHLPRGWKPVSTGQMDAAIGNHLARRHCAT